eukprot:214876_1
MLKNSPKLAYFVSIKRHQQSTMHSNCIWYILFQYLLVISKCEPPNFVIILMDDQDVLLNSPSYMPNLQNLIVNEGVTFNNAFVSTPVCCPSRTELISGKYFHNIGAPDGSCMHIDADNHVFSDKSLFSILNKNGYKAGVFGKLTNHDKKYFCTNPQNISETGLSRVYSMCDQEDYWCTQYYSKYDNGTNEIIKLSYNDQSTYQTAQIGNTSIKWIKNLLSKDASQPWIAYIGPHSPHVPNNPPPWFANNFADITAPQTENFNVKVNGQMEWVNNNPKLDNVSIQFIDQKYRNRLRSALQVDVIIKELIKTLKNYNVLQRTHIIYSSDHGYHLGQWRLGCEKSFVFDTDIRVPLYWLAPNVKKQTNESYIVGNIDIMPTILDLANITVSDNLMDGKSFASKISNVNKTVTGPWREYYLIEYMAHGDQYFNECRAWYDNKTDFHGDIIYPSPFQGGNNKDIGYVDWGVHESDGYGNTWRQIRIINKTHDWSYSEYIDLNFSDKAKNHPYLYVLYDVAQDPYQIKNIYNKTSNDIKQELHDMLMEYGNCAGANCP